ncbi:MAG TPA: hypothetical protein PL009_14615 [Flavipsychrobacter sp.]|nr:hypothetical protein [Flavipsychrobacter sp.]
MDIIQRNNKYFLQLANGELELTEQQVKKRVERGDKLHEFLQKLEKKEPEIPVKEDAPKSAQSFITSGKYFDNLIREFEQIYRTSEDKEDAEKMLIQFCKNAINKLHLDRKNPKTDHVVIDYYILSWSRVISFVQGLANIEPEEVMVSNTQTEVSAEGRLHQPRNIVKQLLIIQLMQADGLFPISDALSGISQDDISTMMCGVLDADKATIAEALQQSSAILLKRAISQENREERIKLLEELDHYFEQLPYPNIISRVKLLLKIYREQS